MARPPKNPADFIVPMNINGMQGRMMRMPAPKNKTRELLFIYGHHSSLERWWGLIQDLNQYGAITMPDLPGFGGMESLYRIGEKPDIDTMADYLATFIKLRYRRRRVTIFGLSFGFVVVTRMLQRYPDLAKRVDMLVSVVGFSHRDDFKISRWRIATGRTTARFLSHRLPALFFRNVCLHPMVLKAVYARTGGAREKFESLQGDDFRETMDFEIFLWHANDVRTHMRTLTEMLKIDNCQKQIDMPVWHVAVDADRYFDNNMVEQHMRVIFTDFYMMRSKMSNHAPSVIADKKAAAAIIPPALRKALRS
ncbi:MAG TPA: alpha/beta hydrolase [Verrucomicrobiae bacterium]|nr:alpha/beta hydrolase [Verrucomicrobiae bacterium]